MNISDSQKPYLLSKADNDLIFQVILEEAFSSKQRPSHRVAYFTAGQPGSGKTTLRDFLLENGKDRSTIEINTDNVRKYHPAYEQLLQHPSEFARAGYLVNPNSAEWCARLSEKAAKEGYCVLHDMTFAGNVELYMQMMKQQYKANDYRVELHALAVNPSVSRLGIHLRYERQLQTDGVGRFVSMASHDANYQALNGNIEKATASGIIDHVSVYSRSILRQTDGTIVNNAVKQIYSEEKANMRAAQITGVMHSEQTRPFSSIEKAYLNGRVNQVHSLIEFRNGDKGQFLEDSAKLLKEISSQRQRRSI